MDLFGCDGDLAGLPRRAGGKGGPMMTAERAGAKALA
jgi:hypothetical protein